MFTGLTGNGSSNNGSFIRSLRGTESPRRSLDIEPAHAVCQVLDDGSSIVMYSEDQQNWDIGLVTPGATEVRPLAAEETIEFQPQVSPNGKWLAYSTLVGGQPEVFVQDFPDGARRWKVSSAGGAEPFFSPDGTEITYLDFRSRLMAVSIEEAEDFRPGIPRTLFVTGATGNFQTRNRYYPFPDGERYLVAAPLGDSGARKTTVILNWPALMEKKVTG